MFVMLFYTILLIQHLLLNRFELLISGSPNRSLAQSNDKLIRIYRPKIFIFMYLRYE